MRECKPLISTALSACLLAVLVTLGCSNAKTRQAGQDLLSAVAEAHAHSEAAIAIMANPVVKVEGNIVPLAKPLVPASEPVSVEAPDAVNPAAYDSLKKAQDILTAAIAANADAPADTIAVAQGALGRVQMLMGDYSTALARIHYGGAAKALAATNGELSTVRNQATLKKYIDLSASAKDEELTALGDKDALEIKGLKGKIDEKKKFIADQKAAIDALNAVNDKLVTQAAQKHTASDNAKGQARVDLFKEAAKIDKEILVNSGKISQLEDAIAKAELEKRHSELALKTKEEESKAVSLMLSSRSQGRTKLAAEGGENTQALAQSIKAAEQGLGNLDKSLTEMGAATAEARKSYEAAEGSYKKMLSADSNQAVDANAAQAEAKLAMARLDESTLGLQGPLKVMCDQAGDIWKGMGQNAPPAVAKVAGFGGDAAALHKDAAGLYEQAATLYAKVVQKLPAENRWAAQAQMAVANAGWYRMSGDEKARDAALKAVADALVNKRYSPYLINVVLLEEQLKAVSAPTPTPTTGAAEEPAVTPAPTTPAPTPAVTPEPATPTAPATAPATSPAPEGTGF